ncbi:DNA internalization-related competence protein ComEC/Rec2 [Vibrio sp. Isolate24]|uniref:DNA internalization-related competence protein ComEC/Rec2 n=1 Tax=Vibrio sp. Isolate24 TaxID=2908534 RepID=UPI001EFE2C78|nr:DNA internalization-related competence protein ComEC/Rec2 [Vibrio sp. Isolate24]MCG9678578.1 DNA internalization-related competence protein ComEC/Rec2 [Vibrio sp. Isolate24]
MTLYFNYWTLISFSFLISTAQFWWYMPSWEWLFPCLLTLMLSISSKSLRWCAGFVFACLILVVHSNLLRHQQAILFQAGQDITINAKVDSFFKQISHGFQGEAVVRSINGKDLHILLRPRIWLASPDMLTLGDEITARVKLKPIVGLLNEVGFDRETYALQKRIVGKATVKVKAHYWVRQLSTIRYSLYQQVADSIDLLPSRGIILALTFGVRDALTAELKEHLKASGLSHLIAISGLHIGIVFYVGWLLGKWVLRALPKAVHAPFVIAIALASTYAWLAGFSIPTQRALWACCLMVLLQVSFKRLPASYKWLMILSWLLMLDPFSSTSSSLWLSMWAVAIILIFVSLHPRASWINALRLQLVLVVGMTPLVAASFYGLSLSSFLYNLVFVPWFSFIVVPMTLLALMMECLLNASFMWGWVDVVLKPVLFAIPLAENGWVTLSQHQIALLFLGFFFLVLTHWLSRLGMAAIVICLFIHTINWRTPPVWQVFVLDVGHGLAIVVKQGSHAIVYDTGMAWSGSSIAEQVITPFLHYHGVDEIDMLIVSHSDMDHSGGMEHLIQYWQPKKLIASQQITGAQACLRGSDLQWGNLELEFLWPSNVVKRAYNPHSCVVRLFHPEFQQSVLLSGDVDAIVEWLLVREAELLDSDILIAPHHGSRTSSTPRFIESVSPELAIGSTAKAGKWFLPHPSVVKRYQKLGAQWLDTGSAGQISISFYPLEWKVEAIRARKGRAWYRQTLRKGVE